ncbi:MAG: hypothetical protein IPO17_17865 [Flavobacteriales bacterium]|nr:hypothetical protein [Flavobacteriales bacterium]
MRDARLREEAEKNERIKKLKQDVSDKEAADAEAARLRREEGVQRKSQHEENKQQLYTGSEDLRLTNAERVAAEKEALAAAERARTERSASSRESSYSAKLQTEQSAAQKQEAWRDHHHIQTENAAEQAERFKVAEQKRQDNSADRREDALAANKVYDRNATDLQDRGAELADRNQQRVEGDKAQQQAHEAARIANAESARASAKNRLDGVETNKPKDYRDYNATKLAQEYPQGVTEESYTEGNKVVIRRIVVQGNKADVYSKVIAKWGTNYFKNGQAISEEIWRAGTEE